MRNDLLCRVAQRTGSPKALLAAAIIVAPPVFAQQNPGKEVSAMGVITVTAGRGTDLESLPLSTSVITRQEVQNEPVVTTDQVINKIPGVFVPTIPSTELHPTGGTFSIRGFGTSTNVNTLVMVDGIPFNDPFFRTVNWARIPKFSIDSIEVIRGGGATSLWGNLAMGGIVNIVTRPPQDDTLSVYADYGSYSTLNTGFSGALFRTDKVSMGISYDYGQSLGYNVTPEQYRSPYMTATGSQVNNLTLATYFTPTADSKYYARLNLNTTAENTATWENASNNWNSVVLSGGGSTRFADDSSINVSAWGSFQQMKTTNSSQSPAYNLYAPNAAVPYVGQKETDNYQSYGASLFYQRDFGQFRDVKFGVDGRLITSDDNINQYSSASFNTANLINRGQNTFQGLFVTGTYRFDSTPLDVNFGLRQDFYQVSNSSLDGTIYNTKGGATPFGTSLANNSYSSLDPSLGLKYYVNDNFDVRGAIYRNFAAPGMNQLYRTFLSGSSLTIANPYLAPQTNFGQEVGFDLNTTARDANLSVTAFNNQLSNFLDLATMCSSAAACNPAIAGTGMPPGSVSTLRQYVNAGNATIRGYEILANAQVHKTLNLTGGFTQTWAYLTRSDYNSGANPSDPTNAQLGQVPPWMLQLGAQWQALPDLNLSAQLQSFPAFWNNTAHTQLNDGATLVNVGFRYQIDKSVQVYGSIQNLFNTQYLAQGMTYTTFEGGTVNSASAPMLGLPRWFTLGVRATF